MSYDIKLVQTRLNELDFGPLVVDGIFGPKTGEALTAFKASQGLRARPYLGPITYAKLTGRAADIVAKTSPAKASDPVWITEMLKFLGEHERDPEISAWLKSDGSTVGDPAKVPWCGDAVETALKSSLGPSLVVPKNPYLALNWLTWGYEVKPQRGAIMVFWRGSPSSWKGHIGFYMGESTSNYYILGGNQGNKVTIAPIAKNRLRKGGSRWVSGGPDPSGAKVIMSGGVVSTNEA